MLAAFGQASGHPATQPAGLWRSGGCRLRVSAAVSGGIRHGPGSASPILLEPLAVAAPLSSLGQPALDRARRGGSGSSSCGGGGSSSASGGSSSGGSLTNGSSSSGHDAAHQSAPTLDAAATSSQAHQPHLHQHDHAPVAGTAPLTQMPEAVQQATSAGQQPEAAPTLASAHPGTLWGLGVLTLGYLHLSTTLYTLPSLLPTISEELHLNDTQGGLLTTGYTILYGLCMVPVGLLADSVHRPRLLAGGIALWSLLTMAASSTTSFGGLMATRVVFAFAQATQNPVAYSLIPELFPNNRNAAMAFYNSAIYVGRALAFGVVILVGQQMAAGSGSGGGEADLGAAASALAAVLGDDPASSWRSLLWWLAPPGLLTAALALFTIEEPRQRSARTGHFMPLVTISVDSMDDDNGSDSAAAAAAAAVAMAQSSLAAAAQPAAADAAGAHAAHSLHSTHHSAHAVRTLVSAPEEAAPSSLADKLVKLRELMANPGFLALTAAASVNDVASWSLIGWQSTFCERVQGLEPAVYAPLVAGGICLGGIAGGVGAAVFGDRATERGLRGWLTAGTSVAAAPLVAASFLVTDYRLSFAALLVGYALSECWRSPVAVMVREVSPPGLGSTASAVHLGIRCLAGAMGPIAIAALSGKVGLQMAMLLIPACHLVSGLGLAATEEVLKGEKAKAKAKGAARHKAAGVAEQAASPS